MAKVGTEKYSIGGNYGESQEFDVFFTKKDGFYCKLPKVVQELVPDNKGISGDSYDDAVKNTKQFIDKIYQDGFECKKIILYFIKLGCSSIEYSNKVEKGKSSIEVNNSFYSMRTTDKEPGNELEFDFHIRYMVTVAGKKYISKWECKQVSDLKHADRWHWSTHGGYSEQEWMSWEFMDHTEDLEKWFENTKKGLQMMLSKIFDFFGEDKVSLLKSIQASTNNLLEYTGNKK